MTPRIQSVKAFNSGRPFSQTPNARKPTIRRHFPFERNLERSWTWNASRRTFSPNTGRIFARAFRVTLIGGTLLFGAFALGPNPDPAAVAATPELAGDEPDSDPLNVLSPAMLEESLAHFAHHSNADLIRSWLTYLLCGSDLLVEYGPDLLESFTAWCDKLPLGAVPKAVIEFLVRNTFFFQYVGGESPKKCEPVLRDLLDKGVASLFAYSVEGPSPRHSTAVPVACEVSKRHIVAIRKAIDTAALFGPEVIPGETKLRPTSVAIKLSGLVTDPYVLVRASKSLTETGGTPWGDLDGLLFPGTLTAQDKSILEDLLAQLSDLSQASKEKGVRLIIDAEYTWMQPAIDRITQVLSSRFNDPHSPPIIYHTFQAYLRSTPSRLASCLASSTFSSRPFSTGIKLVRGAYLSSEPLHHRSAGLPGLPPTWSTKAETDECYDTLAADLTARVARVLKGIKIDGKIKEEPELGLIVAGHNVASIRKVLERLRDVEGVAENRGRYLALSDELRGRLMFGQILGMGDNLSSTLLTLLTPSHGHAYTSGADLPFLLKYVPFGNVAEVMPYLGRRAQENKYILKDGSGRGGAKEERKAVGREMRRRVRALLGLEALVAA